MSYSRMRSASRPGRVAAAVLLGTLIVCACGQKGPLYLPDEQKQTVKKSPIPIPPSVSKEDKNRDKDESKAP